MGAPRIHYNTRVISSSYNNNMLSDVINEIVLRKNTVRPLSVSTMSFCHSYYANAVIPIHFMRDANVMFNTTAIFVSRVLT